MKIWKDHFTSFILWIQHYGIFCIIKKSLSFSKHCQSQHYCQNGGTPSQNCITLNWTIKHYLDSVDCQSVQPSGKHIPTLLFLSKLKTVERMGILATETCLYMLITHSNIWNKIHSILETICPGILFVSEIYLYFWKL